MALCSVCPHPGGEKLTSRMTALGCFRAADRVLDLGCGGGDSVRLLRKKGIDAIGLETDAARCDGSHVLHYGGRVLPFPEASFDGALMECVLSCVDDPEETLKELRRVLRPEGTLAVSDLTAGEASETADVRGLHTKEEYRKLFRCAGFTVYYEEDASEGLLQLFGQLLLSGGEEAVEEVLGLSRAERKRLRPGYRLWILVPDRYQELAARTRDLPFTEETSLTGNPPRLLKASPKDIARIITVGTSGSTGEKKRIWFTEKDLFRTVDFFTPGMAPMVDEGDLVTVFMRGTGLYSIAGLLQAAVEPLGCSVKNHGDITDLGGAAEAAAAADCLVMLPGDAAAMAALYPGLRPKSVLLSADYIPQSVVRRIETTWKCRLFLHWGMTETGYGGAVTAAPGGPYLLRRDLFAEIVDPETGTRLPFGEQGEIVITTLQREGMPLTRYRTGDLGRLAIDENGRPGLTDLAGRISDPVPLPDGRSISIRMLDEILYGEPNLVWYEAALTAAGTLKIGWQGRNSERETEPSLPVRLKKRILAHYQGLDVVFYPAAFCTGKRKLRMEV